MSEKNLGDMTETEIRKRLRELLPASTTPLPHNVTPEGDGLTETEVKEVNGLLAELKARGLNQ